MDGSGSVYRDIHFLSQATHRLDMVGMVVRYQDCHDFGKVDRFIFQHLLYGTYSDTSINQYPEFGSTQIIAVATASTC